MNEGSQVKKGTKHHEVANWALSHNQDYTIKAKLLIEPIRGQAYNKPNSQIPSLIYLGKWQNERN